MVASAAALERGNGGVLGVAGGMVSACVRGESERRSAAMGRGGALARPGTCPCARWRRWASWARHVLTSVGLSLVKGVYQHVCGSEGSLNDMVM
jgi:hypothetical protein